MKNSMVILLIIVVVAVVGISAAVLLNSNNTTVNTSNSTTPTPVTPPTTPPTGTSAKSDVSIANMSFPLSTIINKGQTVVWTNNDSVSHTVTSDLFNSGTIAPGGTFTHQFDTAGTFTYHCNFHSNMVGTVVVN
ncbi:MAG: cupredoxin domain-containing protein [Candidatus Dojkabacteria bacterium]